MLCRYHYDPLDRLVGTTPLHDAKSLRFYCKSRLATEIQGAVKHSVFQQEDQLLAQRYRQGDVVEISLLATDQMRSVLQVFNSKLPSSIAYSPYGHRPAESGLLSLLGFNGERADPITGYYSLGNGYREFNKVLMRFNSPDNLSPFGKGGLNPYTYCLGDPINRYDESGHLSLPKFVSSFLNRFRTKPKVHSRSSSLGSMTPQNQLYENTIDGVGREKTKKFVRKQYQNKLQKGSPEIVVPVKKIQNAEDLASIPDSEKLRMAARHYYMPYEVNFIFTEHEEFFVANLKHADLSIIANSPRVISAGYIIPQGSNHFTISNSSGHFKPSVESLRPVEEFLTNLGARVNSVRHGSS